MLVAYIIFVLGMACVFLTVGILTKKKEFVLAMIITIAATFLFISTDFLSRGLPTNLGRLKVGEKYAVVVVYDKKYIITKSMANDLLFIGPMKDTSNFVVGSSYIYTSNKKLEKLEKLE